MCECHLTARKCTIQLIINTSSGIKTSIIIGEQALGLQRDDAFSTTMLSQAIEQQMNELQPCKGVPDVLPEYTSSDSPRSSALDMDVTNASCQSQEYDIDSIN
ncbi:hypothetical protein MTO96_042904 [Rhipicephalus appendiculatus]